VPHDIPRRDALAGLCALGTLGLVSCGGSAKNQPTPKGASEAPTRSRGSSPKSSSSAALASVHDIAVGSSILITSPDDQPVILSRPATNKVVGFSAVCTHQGCTVRPASGRLDCPCHGSAFDAMTGAVLRGPAQRPLAGYDVTVVHGQVRQA
jgi:cytochrome b6-f complex iron-sulfur subunit